MQSNNRKNAWNRSGKSVKRSKQRFRPRQPSGRMEIYKAAGSQLWQDVKMLKRMINTEIHFTDAVASAQTMSSTPSLVLLNGISVGDTSNTRTGQSIKLDRLDLRFGISPNSTSILNFCRVLVVADKQTNAAAMTAADLLVSSTPFSPYSFGSQNRFICLFDETYAINYPNLNLTKSVTLPTQFHVTYNSGNAGTVADIVTNSIYLMYLSDVATNQPTISYYSRLWFIDN